MKLKLITLLFSLFISIVTCAQIRFDVKAGVMLNNITQADNYNIKPGFRIGVGTDFKLSERWSIRPSLFLVQKDLKESLNKIYYLPERGEDFIGHIDFWNKSKALYLQIPVLPTATFRINNTLGISIGAGPYIAYGISGDTDIYLKTQSSFTSGLEINPPPDNQWVQKITAEYETFSDEGLKRWDYGLAFTAELNIGQHVFAGIGVEYGLAEIKKDMPKNTGEYLVELNTKTVSPHRYGFDIHIGFRF